MKKQLENGKLTWALDEKEITFSLGELSFKVPRGEFLSLIDRGIMEERFRLSEKPNAAFVELDTPATFARVSRLLRKGLTLDEAARVLKVDAGILRKFWELGLRKYRDNGEARSEGEKQGRAEGDYCKTNGLYEMGRAPLPGVPGADGVKIPEVFVNAADVKRALTRFQDEGVVAGKFKLDVKDFGIWIEKNQYILDVLR